MPTTTRSLVTALAESGLSADPTPVPSIAAAGFIAQWPAQTVLRLTGPAARKFLQGQLTCQIEQLDAGHSLLGASCTPKGKALANFRLLALEDETILMRLSADLEQSLISHFQKYLAFFKAEIAVAEDWCLLGLTGTAGQALLGLDQPLQPNQVSVWQKSRLVGSQPDAEGRSRTEFWLHRADLATLQAYLQKAPGSTPQAPQAAWLAGEIQGGLTTIDAALQDRYVPQYFNWHAVDGINFRKGCYTGQEIIARMHYLGQLKKSTFRVLLPAGGASVLSGITDSDGRAAGEITNLVTYADGHQEALAIIKHSSAATGDLQLADAAQQPVLLASLPYPMPEQELAPEK